MSCEEKTTSRWAEEILAQQRQDGSWGFFHTLSQPVDRRKLTTEQALRRLSRLGCTAEDEPIQRALEYMRGCLAGVIPFPDRREHWRDWALYVSFMLSTWIKWFVPDDPAAGAVARQWARVVTVAFQGGRYDHDAYTGAFVDAFGMRPHVGRDWDFVTFYQVVLLRGYLDEETEARVMDYILDHDGGIYYIYPRRLSCLPNVFSSLDASRYLGAVELLAEYHCAPEKLKFVREWLMEQRGSDGLWDMGAGVKDGVYFPLSDSWRLLHARKADCTKRIGDLLAKLE